MPNAAVKRKASGGEDRPQQLYDRFRNANAKLVGPAGDTRVLPESLNSFLAELNGLLSDGKSVAIVRDEAQLTTIEAAALLGVSRQFLVNLLENGEIPHHKVGTHRRMYAEDVYRYKAHRDMHRHKVIRELAKAEARDGLYGRAPASPDEK
jgi:excisionase family DNA binding protein